MSHLICGGAGGAQSGQNPLEGGVHEKPGD